MQLTSGIGFSGAERARTWTIHPPEREGVRAGGRGMKDSPSGVKHDE